MCVCLCVCFNKDKMLNKIARDNYNRPRQKKWLRLPGDPQPHPNLYTNWNGKNPGCSRNIITEPRVKGPKKALQTFGGKISMKRKGAALVGACFLHFQNSHRHEYMTSCKTMVTTATRNTF